jgi:regulator of sigma E protease
MGLIIAILVLSALIFFHELGHYLMAKALGVYTEVFSIGFGKKIASFRMFNTEWRISAIPLGGYVRMKGQDDSNPLITNRDKDSYNAKTPVERILILLAGPGANFILAFFLYIAIGIGQPNVLSPIVGKVLPNSPALAAGLQVNDKIIVVNGQHIDSWEGLTQVIANKSVHTLHLTILRDKKTLQIDILPKMRETTDMFHEKIYKPMIGIVASGATHKLNNDFDSILKYAVYQTKFASTMIFKSVEKLIVGVIPAKDVGGVISIVKITSDATAQGWMAVLFFTALISVNLGVLNLLPIPALDGGHIMFNLYELVARRAPTNAMLMRLTIAGWVLLFGLMGLGLYNDLHRLLG